MKIADNKAVSVNYHLTASKNNGPEELVEQTSNEPFVFLFGFGQLLPDFEAALEGKQVGDKFDFRITAANGYGLVEQDCKRALATIEGNQPHP